MRCLTALVTNFYNSKHYIAGFYPENSEKVGKEGVWTAKTANITKDDITCAAHRQNVTVLRSNCHVIFCDICCFSQNYYATYRSKARLNRLLEVYNNEGCNVYKVIDVNGVVCMSTAHLTASTTTVQPTTPESTQGVTACKYHIIFTFDLIVNRKWCHLLYFIVR